MPSLPDYYQILGVSPAASQDEIKREYRKLAIQYHPDKNPTNTEQATERFKSVAEAYDVLSHPTKRTEYDVKREQHAVSGHQGTAARASYHAGQSCDRYTSNFSTSNVVEDSLFHLFEDLIATHSLFSMPNMFAFDSFFPESRSFHYDPLYAVDGWSDEILSSSLQKHFMAKSLFDNTTAHVLRTVTSMGPDGRKVTHVETFVRERSSNKSGSHEPQRTSASRTSFSAFSKPEKERSSRHTFENGTTHRGLATQSAANAPSKRVQNVTSPRPEYYDQQKRVVYPSKAQPQQAQRSQHLRGHPSLFSRPVPPANGTSRQYSSSSKMAPERVSRDITAQQIFNHYDRAPHTSSSFSSATVASPTLRRRGETHYTSPFTHMTFDTPFFSR